MKELFLSMYKDPGHSKIKAEPADSRMKHTVSLENARGSHQDEAPSKTTLSTPTPTPEELQSLAQTFADSLPESQLSLAAIQGFLLGYKRDPQGGAEKAKAWADNALKEAHVT